MVELGEEVDSCAIDPEGFALNELVDAGDDLVGVVNCFLSVLHLNFFLLHRVGHVEVIDQSSLF